MIQDILNEVARATKKFPTWPNDIIHAAGVVVEESGELMKAALESVYEFPKSTPEDVRKEAVETAAMAIRFIMSWDEAEYNYKKSKQHKQKSGCAACDRGDYSLGHSDFCDKQKEDK